MNRSMTLPIVALGLLVAATASSGCRGFTFEKQPLRFQQNMYEQTHLKPQEGSSFWADGRGMRPRVEGTVARGHLRVDSHRYEGRVDGAWATTLPMPMTESLLDRGQERYEIFCAPCHGAAGHGEAAVPSRSTWIVPTLHADRSRAMPVGELYDIIAHGVNTMPAYAAQIPVDDRWAIAAWVRALQVSQGMTTEHLPADIAATIPRGQ